MLISNSHNELSVYDKLFEFLGLIYQRFPKDTPGFRLANKIIGNPSGNKKLEDEIDLAKYGLSNCLIRNFSHRTIDIDMARQFSLFDAEDGRKVLFYIVLKTDSIKNYYKRNNEAYHKTHMCLFIIERIQDTSNIQQKCILSN